MSSWNIYTYTDLSISALLAITSANGYRPISWSISTNVAQSVYLRTNIAGYFFDAILREVHDTTLKITEHPVQTGANIVDHSFQMPARLTLEIGMSDVMASFVTGQWSGYSTKSVSAYQTLLSLQSSRMPLKVVTQLNSYENMLIEHMSAPKDYKTLYGLRVTVSMRQIMTAEVTETTGTSNRSQATDTTNKGTVGTTTTTNTSLDSRIITNITGNVA